MQVSLRNGISFLVISQQNLEKWFVPELLHDWHLNGKPSCVPWMAWLEISHHEWWTGENNQPQEFCKTLCGGHFSASLEITTRVSLQEVLWKINNYFIKTYSYLHIRVGYAPRIKQMIMNICRFYCIRSPSILAVTKILHIQILRLQLSMIFASITLHTKDINIPSFPTRKKKSVILEHL